MPIIMTATRAPFRELSPNKKILESVANSENAKISKKSLIRRNRAFDWSVCQDLFSARWKSTEKSWTNLSEIPSSPPKHSDSKLLASPMPLLPRAASTGPSNNPADSCQKHADRLKARLRLAVYKIATNQEDVALSNIALRDVEKFRSFNESSIINNIYPDDNDTTASSNQDITSKSTSLKHFVTPPRRPRTTKPVRPDDGLPSSSPVKSTMGSAVKNTPASMGAAKSLLSLGAL